MPRIFSSFASFGVLSGLMLLVSGCSKSSSVTGTVKHKGQPVDGAMVQLFNDQGIAVASGSTDSSGNFKLVDSHGKTAIPAGTYKAVVTKVVMAGVDADKLKDSEGNVSPDAMKGMLKGKKEIGGGPIGVMGPMAGGKGKSYEKSLLPDVFRSPSTSTLTVTVPTSGSVVLDLGN